MYLITQNSTLRIAISLTICATLLPLASIAPFVSGAAAQGQGDTNGSKGKQRRGKPEGTFPNLDDVKNESQLERDAPPPIPSTLRSPKNGGKPWDGRRVGDPETLQRQLDQAAVIEKQTRRAHARRRINPPPTQYEDQFIQNFFSFALLRSANYDETLYWNYQLRAAYYQGQVSLKLAGVELGKTLFESASYAARNRDAHWYVYDLFKTYLMREPDSSGWASWEGLVPTHGREYVRRGFEESGEFASLVATILPSGSPGANTSSLISARVEPRHQPGNGMLARDASWSVPLLNLPGRNGLDLGLVLSYSSLVWTPSGPYFHFDEDNGFPSPGFRLGFPTVQRKVFDAQTAKNAFLLITPTGHRVELRQVGTSNIYEAADSSYLQLTDNGPQLLVRSTDGTQLSFVEINNEFSCTQVKDRNGNYITVNHNALGRISSVTDTLGRVITFNYDSNANLISITQAWNGQPAHQWVSFGWSTRNMQYSFATDKVVGTAYGAAVPVVTQVALNDTSYFTFDYNSSLQVSAVRNYFGTLERNATTFLYETPSGDVPRLASSSVSARNWSGFNNVPAQVTTSYSVAGDGACVLTAPDGTEYREYYGTGWQRGLTTLSEVWSGGVRQKWTTLAWTQDNTGVAYELNPRVVETNVYDSPTNRRRTAIEYTQFGLPSVVREYAVDGPEIRQTITDYNLNQVYLNQRIIGLVSQVLLMSGGQPSSKTTFTYDDPNRLQAVPAAATQHDAAYSASFTGRGNVTGVSRWDVTDVNNAAKKLTTSTNYYTTGTPVSTTDPSGHQSSVSYADSFSDGVNRNTFAYPTTSTDADTFSSYVQYNFDFGATTRTQSPTPAGQGQGAVQTMTYNSLGQLERVTTTNNGAYKRFWYGAEYTASYATVNSVADESYSIQVTDGLGRVLGAVGNHPGSTGGYRLVNTVYNLMGRAWLQSNPTEVDNTWAPKGDDVAGLHYTQQTYDWQGRPLRTTHPDLTYNEIAYSGCGCTGNQLITLTDEGTIDGGVTKRRQQKIYSDILGRTVKTELLNWQNGTPYSTTVNVFNARDQVEQILEYAGAEGGATVQSTTMTYDGLGSLKTQHKPEQQPQANNTASSDHTTFNYNADGTVSYLIDARGVKTNLTYNNRHQVTGINYDTSLIVSPFNIVGPTSAQSFTYDDAGNRTAMNDGTGEITYQYNSLSQLSSEIRKFAGPFATTPFILTYTYNLAGEIKSLTLPSQFGTNLTYDYDPVGRLTGITGSGYTYTNTSNPQQPVEIPVSSFLSNAGYRAWNDLKSMDNGSSTHKSFSYDQMLRPTSYNVTAGSSAYTWNYTYFSDGRTKLVSDLSNDHFDKAYTYDHVGRMTDALSGREARGLTPTPTPDSPYRQTFQFNAFDQQVRETGRIWQRELSGPIRSYANNRRLDLMYDPEGHVISDAQGTHSFDAAGERFFVTAGVVGGGLSGHTEMPAEQRAITHDSDGRPVKSTAVTRIETLVGSGPQTSISENTEIIYYLRSTVLGGYVVGELNSQGQKVKQYIYAGGERVAEQWSISGFNTINWQHRNPLTDSWISVTPVSLFSFRTEVDSHGRETGLEAPTILPNEPSPPPTRAPSYLEMQGGPTIEAELGQQLYEDIYINKIFKDGNGPGEGAFDRLRTIRETQLRQGGTFLLGMGRFDALENFGAYEAVQDGVTPSWEEGERALSISYYRFLPGADRRKPSGNPFNKMEESAAQNASQSQEVPCDPKFFDENRSYNIAGDAQNRSFSGADLNYAARVVFAESTSSTSGLGDQVNLERDAIASALYNRLGVPGFPDRIARNTFTGVSQAPNAFESVTGSAHHTQKFRSSEIASGAYRNLQNTRLNSRGQEYGGACNDLRGSVDAIKRLVRSGSQYGYTQFRAGTTGQGTVIGGSRFW